MDIIGKSALCAVIVFLSAGCGRNTSHLDKVTALPDYPSGSGIAYLNKKLYLMGDDAPYLLVLDTAFNKMDTIHFFDAPGKRIPKDIKADPEAAAVVWVNKAPLLLIVGSGSLVRRDSAWTIDPVTKERTVTSLDTFYDRLKKAGIKELNIEGAAGLPGGIVLANRGNKAYPKNQLIFTSLEFWKDQADAPISIANVGVNTDTAVFTGVSGLEYSVKTDRLFVTVSTEDTYSTHGDGAIGKSYLWIINDITGKRAYSGMNPTRVIDLEEMDTRFKGQKIESVALLSENKKETHLVLVSDDDKGGTVLFKVRVATSGSRK
jgi:hypothetical protein